MQRSAILSAIALSFVFASPRASADVDPASVDITIGRGANDTLPATLTLPDQPPKLDVLFLVDLSNSYTDGANGPNDIDRIKQFAPEIFDGVRAVVPDSQFAVATFSDFPFPAWGQVEIAHRSIVAADSAYRLELDLTADRSAWLDTVNGLCTPESARCGSLGDDRESQYEALFQSVTGIGLNVADVPGAPVDLGDIAAGQQVSFREDAIKVIVLTTDAPFHEAGDFGFLFPYPGASRNDAVLALQDAGVKVVVIKGIDDGLPRARMFKRDRQMVDLADATGGAVVDSATDDSRDIVATLTEGLRNITYTVRARPRPTCFPLKVEFAPGFYETASSGEPLPMEISVTVPAQTNKTSVGCIIDYLADGVVIDSQRIDVTIPSSSPSSPCPNRGPVTRPPADGEKESKSRKSKESKSRKSKSKKSKSKKSKSKKSKSKKSKSKKSKSKKSKGSKSKKSKGSKSKKSKDSKSKKSKDSKSKKSKSRKSKDSKSKKSKGSKSKKSKGSKSKKSKSESKGSKSKKSKSKK